LSITAALLYARAVGTDSLNCSLAYSNSWTRSTYAQSNSPWIYFISPTDLDCWKTGSGCTGSYTHPFDDISQVLYDLHMTKKIGLYQQVEVRIYLLSGGTHYFLDRHIRNSSNPNNIIYRFTVFLEDQANSNFIDPFFYRAFDRVSAIVTLSPAYLNVDGCTSTSVCFTSG
jgi:hypothetical protein